MKEIKEVVGRDKKGEKVVQGAFVDIEVLKIGRRTRKSQRLSGIVIGSWEDLIVVMTGAKGRGASCFCHSSKVNVIRDPEVDCK